MVIIQIPDDSVVRQRLTNAAREGGLRVVTGSGTWTCTLEEQRDQTIAYVLRKDRVYVREFTTAHQVCEYFLMCFPGHAVEVLVEGRLPTAADV